MDKGGQSLGLLQASSSRCVLVCAVSDHGKHCKALVSFSTEDFDSNTPGLENLSVQVLLLLCSMVWMVLLSHL